MMAIAHLEIKREKIADFPIGQQKISLELWNSMKKMDVLWNQGSPEYFETEKRDGALGRIKEKPLENHFFELHMDHSHLSKILPIPWVPSCFI